MQPSSGEATHEHHQSAFIAHLEQELKSLPLENQFKEVFLFYFKLFTIKYETPTFLANQGKGRPNKLKNH